MEQKNINQRRRTKKATALTKVSEDLLLAQKEIKGIDPENTIGGKIISAASYAIGAVLVATGVGAPVAPCIVPAGKVVNYIWLNKKVIYYTGAEGFASWQHQFADRKYNQAQDNAPDLHSAAITKEEKARNDEAKKSQKLALILARSATTPCEQWVSNIEQLIHADTALCQQLLAECKKDSQWSYTKTLDAWNQRMNVSNDNVASFEHQTSSKTEKLRQLYEQFSQANEEANLRRAVAAGTEVEFKELCQKRELYEKELEEANEKLNLLQNNEVQNLERRNSKRRSTIQKQQEEIASITKLLQNVKETCELIKKKKKLDEAAALESKKTANKIGEAYAHEEVVVLRNYNRAKCRTQGDLQACKNGWPNQLDEIIREQEKKIEKAFEQAEIIPTKENWDEASQATETILSLYDEFIKNREVKLSAQEKKKKNPELENLRNCKKPWEEKISLSKTKAIFAEVQERWDFLKETVQQFINDASRDPGQLSNEAVELAKRLEQHSGLLENITRNMGAAIRNLATAARETKNIPANATLADVTQAQYEQVEIAKKHIEDAFNTDLSLNSISEKTWILSAIQDLLLWIDDINLNQEIRVAEQPVNSNTKIDDLVRRYITLPRRIVNRNRRETEDQKKNYERREQLNEIAKNSIHATSSNNTRSPESERDLAYIDRANCELKEKQQACNQGIEILNQEETKLRNEEASLSADVGNFIQDFTQQVNKKQPSKAQEESRAKLEESRAKLALRRYKSYWDCGINCGIKILTEKVETTRSAFWNADARGTEESWSTFTKALQEAQDFLEGTGKIISSMCMYNTLTKASSADHNYWDSVIGNMIQEQESLRQTLQFYESKKWKQIEEAKDNNEEAWSRRHPLIQAAISLSLNADKLFKLAATLKTEEKWLEAVAKAKEVQKSWEKAIEANIEIEDATIEKEKWEKKGEVARSKSIFAVAITAWIPISDKIKDYIQNPARAVMVVYDTGVLNAKEMLLNAKGPGNLPPETTIGHVSKAVSAGISAFGGGVGGGAFGALVSGPLFATKWPENLSFSERPLTTTTVTAASFIAGLILTPVTAAAGVYMGATMVINEFYKQDHPATQAALAASRAFENTFLGKYTFSGTIIIPTAEQREAAKLEAKNANDLRTQASISEMQEEIIWAIELTQLIADFNQELVRRKK